MVSDTYYSGKSHFAFVTFSGEVSFRNKSKISLEKQKGVYNFFFPSVSFNSSLSTLGRIINLRYKYKKMPQINVIGSPPNLIHQKIPRLFYKKNSSSFFFFLDLHNIANWFCSSESSRIIIAFAFS